MNWNPDSTICPICYPQESENISKQKVKEAIIRYEKKCFEKYKDIHFDFTKEYDELKRELNL